MASVSRRMPTLLDLTGDMWSRADKQLWASREPGAASVHPAQATGGATCIKVSLRPQATSKGGEALPRHHGPTSRW